MAATVDVKYISNKTYQNNEIWPAKRSNLEMINRVKWISTCGRCWFSASCTPSSGLKPRHNPCKTITDVSNSFPYIAKRSPDITFSSHSLLLVISGFLRSRPSGTRMVSISSKSLINGKYTKLANIVNVDAIHSKLLSFFCFKFSLALYFWKTQDKFFII